jgi:hypothetical protein
MAQTLVPNGIPLNFAFTTDGTHYGIADSGGILSGWLLQSTDYEAGADKEDIRALSGDVYSRNWYDIHRKASLRLFITGSGRANAIANTTLGAFPDGTLTPGVLLTITKCPSHPDLVATNWEIQSGTKIAGDVTKSAEITIPLERRPNITSSQAA